MVCFVCLEEANFHGNVSPVGFILSCSIRNLVLIVVWSVEHFFSAEFVKNTVPLILLLDVILIGMLVIVVSFVSHVLVQATLIFSVVFVLFILIVLAM